jgi:hypothetical protein
VTNTFACTFARFARTLPTPRMLVLVVLSVSAVIRLPFVICSKSTQEDLRLCYLQKLHAFSTLFDVTLIVFTIKIVLHSF